MMLCIVITGPTFDEAVRQIARAKIDADLLEFRLDSFSFQEFTSLQKLRKLSALPVIFTLRGQTGKETLLYNLSKLAPDYLDLESHLSPSFIARSAAHCKIILSYHNFSETTDNLDHIYQEMHLIPATFYKIAVTAKNTIDALRLLSWAKSKKDPKLIPISMGDHGEISRILAPILQSPLTYACLDILSAPGQLSAKLLLERYHYKRLTPDTKIYGLIGDPVQQSIGDIFHNERFDQEKVDALYVKMRVPPEELKEALACIKALPFHGLSVTMPLKEVILPYVDHIDPQAQAIGAVNTLRIKEGTLYGYNTDGKGALDALEAVLSVKGKRLIVLGAGGAAKAIVYEATMRGAYVTIVNRDLKKAKLLSDRFHCKTIAFDQMTTLDYDILVNATADSSPIAFAHILPGTVVMDIKTTPKESAFLQAAKSKGCDLVHGHEMFINQALDQSNLWFGDSCLPPLSNHFPCFRT